MATGLYKHERSQQVEAKTAPLTENIYLASQAGQNKTIELVYQNKMDKKEILKRESFYFFKKNNLSSLETKCDIEANAVIFSDNFSAMKNMLENYKGKVNLIYLDPPYATGMSFSSRNQQHAYNDDYDKATWLEFIRKRLFIMKELLSNDGSIYVHIGHQMLFHLKVLMDEIFGENNFRNMIVRKKCSSKNYTSKQYPNLNDYILFYSKTNNYKWNKPGVVPDEEWINKEYPKVDGKGRYKLVPIHAPGTRNGETGKAWKGIMPPPGKHWQLTPEKLDELDKNGDIHWSKNGNPRRKVYLPENKIVPMTDYWSNFRDAHHQSIQITGYPTEKNLEMMKTIIAASSDEGDIVLDPFCGSGTTLHAASKLNRKWVGIDRSAHAIETTIKRLKYGLSPMGDYVDEKNKTKALALLEPIDDSFGFFFEGESRVQIEKEIHQILTI